MLHDVYSMVIWIYRIRLTTNTIYLLLKSMEKSKWWLEVQDVLFFNERHQKKKKIRTEMWRGNIGLGIYCCRKTSTEIEIEKITFELLTWQQFLFRYYHLVIDVEPYYGLSPGWLRLIHDSLADAAKKRLLNETIIYEMYKKYFGRKKATHYKVTRWSKSKTFERFSFFRIRNMAYGFVLNVV